MKRYLAVHEWKGILGAADELSDFDGEVDVVDTQTGEIYSYSGVEWYVSDNVGEYCPDGDDPNLGSGPGTGLPIYVDFDGDDNNDGLDMGTPKKTLAAALELARSDWKYRTVYVKGDCQSL